MTESNNSIDAIILLLDFKEQKQEDLNKALATLNADETPVHYEEWGKADNKDYYYTKDTFKRAGIIIHIYDSVITNVERY